MMKRVYILFLCLFCLCMGMNAQKTKQIRDLEKKHTALKKKIGQSENKLKQNKQDVKKQLFQLTQITSQIEGQKIFIQGVEIKLDTLKKKIAQIEKELSHLETELKEKKQRYEQSVKYLYKNKSIQEKLMFIFSADDLMKMYRRLRYVRKYADYQRILAVQIQTKQAEVNTKRNSLLSAQNDEKQLLQQGLNAKNQLEKQEVEKKTLVGSLQKQQKAIEKELSLQRSSAQKLNAQIDRLIEIEIEKARQRAEEEARKKAEAEKKRIAEEARRRAEQAAKSEKTTKTTTGKQENTTTERTTPAPQQERYKTSSEDVKLSNNFVANKGKLPIPVTGSYMIVGRFGQYNVGGLKNVQLDNKGIDIKTQQGAQARAIFSGEVSAVFNYNGLNNVLIRHGSYISVYCNLSSVSVKRGSKVSTRQSLGTIHTDGNGNTILHFQLRKETMKLNPEHWLGR